METKGYYATVGFFVIALSVIGLTIGLWLSVGLNTTSYSPYLIYMKESVAGLSLSAPVKYNGVDVGYVKKIALDPNDSNQVEVLVSVENGTPINTATRATLNMQGVTGIAYVELRNSRHPALPLTVQPGQQYPVIATAPSLLYRVDAAINHLSESVQAVTGSISTIFNKENGRLLQDTLKNINAVSRNLKDNNDELNRIVKNADALFNNLSAKVPGVMNDTQATIKQSTAALQMINNETLPAMMRLLDEADSVMLRLDGFTQELADNPSMLIRGKAPAPLGPGEASSTAKTRN